MSFVVNARRVSHSAAVYAHKETSSLRAVVSGCARVIEWATATSASASASAMPWAAYRLINRPGQTVTSSGGRDVFVPRSMARANWCDEVDVGESALRTAFSGLQTRRTPSAPRRIPVGRRDHRASCGDERRV